MKAKMKYRKINTGIWNDAKFRSLSYDARFVFIFLLTHPNMTPLGAIRANLPGLAFEFGLEADTFKKAFQEVLDKGIAEQDEEGLLIWFPRFLKHNAPESPNVVKSWIPAVRDLPECALKIRLLQHAACTIDGLSQAFKKAFFEAFGEVCPQGSANQGTGSREQGTKKDAPSGASSPPAGDDAPGSVSEPPDSPPEEPEVPENEQPGEEDGQGPSKCPYAKIVAEYNAVLGGLLPQVREITDKRRRDMRARWTSHPERQNLDWWRGYFTQVSLSLFLTGQKTRFRSTFDWLIHPGNMVKVLEGNFDEKANNNGNGEVTHGDIDAIGKEWADPSRNRWATSPQG
jgi:hypothetical protein